jgi:hypothetical protein
MFLSFPRLPVAARERFTDLREVKNIRDGLQPQQTTFQAGIDCGLDRFRNDGPLVRTVV